MGRRERDREEGRREAGREGMEGGREYLGDIAFP
jgi:hypothetical protein